MKVMRGKRVYCEDTSSIIRSFRTCKNHGKPIQIKGIQYEYIGDNLLFNTKTFRVEKLSI